MRALEFIPVEKNNVSTLQEIEALAHTIWEEHYTPLIGAAQVAYMLDKFQSISSMQEQIATGYQYFLLKHQSKTIGYCSIRPQEESLFLSKVYLLKEERGNGFFKPILHFISEQARSLGLMSISLTVNRGNKGSIDAYLHSGFMITQEAVFDIGNGFVMDDYVMCKDLRTIY